jgi:hypothetical protein
VLATWAVVMLGGHGMAQAAFDRSHSVFDAILRDHVVEGRVEYRRLVADPRALGTYIKDLGAVTPAELAGWPREDQLAFWINSYNAFVLMSVVERYPLRRHTLVGLAFPANSIWQVPGVWKAPRWRAAGHAVSLDMIEHKIIRPAFREPRIHFALVCAASSCPDLRAEAYRGDRLNEQLEDQARKFLANRDKGVRLENDRVLVSKIFDWYGGDFTQGVLRFISNHSADPAIRESLQNARIRIGYLPYDWTLNDQARH